MKTDTTVVLLIFRIWPIINIFGWQHVWRMNSFQIAKVQPQGCCWAFAWFFVDFSLVLLIKVLLIRQKLLLESAIFKVFGSSTRYLFIGLFVHFVSVFVLLILSSNDNHIKLQPVFFFGSMNWCKKEEKRENSSECFTHGLGKAIRVFNQVLSKMSWETKLKFSSTILQ